jgi:hypothetical protein
MDVDDSVKVAISMLPAGVDECDALAGAAIDASLAMSI